MAGGTVIVWLAVVALAAYARSAEGGPHREGQANTLILCGAIAPAVVLAGLLMYGLSMIPELTARAPEGSLRIHVYGERWWWRIRYEPQDRPAFEIANEVRLPVGEPVEFLLHSYNVIHSFWIPSLGGKMDLIPGRVNRLTLYPTRVGTFRGACAEYCGIAHARMSFMAIVTSRDEFERWLIGKSEPRASLGRKDMTPEEELH